MNFTMKINSCISFFRRSFIGLLVIMVVLLNIGCSDGGNSGDNSGANVNPVALEPVDPDNLFIGRINVLVGDYDVVENPGDADITNFDPQLLIRVENEENTVTCSAIIEQLVSIPNINSLFDQYVANSPNSDFVLINDFTTEGIPAKEAIVETTLSGVLPVTSIVQVYFLSESITTYGIATAFYIDCNTSTALFSINETQIRSFLQSIDFLTEEDLISSNLGDFSARNILNSYSFGLN